MITDPSRTDLPNIYGKDGHRRPDVERRLSAAVKRGLIFAAHINHESKKYRIVTTGGVEFLDVTLREANMIAKSVLAVGNSGPMED